MIRWVDSLLHLWGRWAVSVESRSVGYPSVSPMFRDMTSSGVFDSRIPAGVCASDLNEVSRAVDELPLFHRAVVVMTYSHRLSRREVAAGCGVKHDTVTKYLDAAHKTLASQLSMRG